MGEVLRRITGKSITDVSGSVQLSADQEAGAEPALYVMRDSIANEDTEAVLLIDAENAFKPSIESCYII